jgi:GNAT superfamily N-acetyltransferase
MSKNDYSQKSIFLKELEENLWETWSIWGRGPGCSLYDSDRIIWFETPLPIIPYNGVLKFQQTDRTDQEISKIIDHFNKKKAQFFWILHPTAEPADLRELLLKKGMQDVEPIFGMARTLENLEEIPKSPEDIIIKKVDLSKDASAFYQFATWRWNVPDQYQKQYESIAKTFRFGEPDSKSHMWQAWREGQPVAKAGMHITHGSVGIYAVVTKPEARRLGLAKALTLHALHTAHNLGSKVAVLHSTPMAERLYHSIGFETIAEFRLFASEEVYI